VSGQTLYPSQIFQGILVHPQNHCPEKIEIIEETIVMRTLAVIVLFLDSKSTQLNREERELLVG
jgi:hypothetical protein